jgi:hypothetical protein
VEESFEDGIANPPLELPGHHCRIDGLRLGTIEYDKVRTFTVRTTAGYEKEE